MTEPWKGHANIGSLGRRIYKIINSEKMRAKRKKKLQEKIAQEIVDHENDGQPSSSYDVNHPREAHTLPYRRFLSRAKRNKDKYLKGRHTRQYREFEADADRGNPHPGALILARLHRRLTERNLRRPTSSKPKHGDKRSRGRGVEPERPILYLNPPPSGKEVHSIQELSRVPNSFYVLTVMGLRIAISLEERQSGLEQFGTLTYTFRVTLISTNEVAHSGLELWNGSLVAVLQRLLSFTVDRAIDESGSEVNAARLIQMSVANSHAIDRQVSSGIFTDIPANRVSLMRALLDALLVTTNSSDNPTNFQELVVSATVTFPQHNVNPMAGNGLPKLSNNKVIPFGIRLHKSKAFGKNRPSGQIMYVKTPTKCWAIAVYLAIVHNVVKKKILKIEFGASKKKSDVPRRRARTAVVKLRKRLFALMAQTDDHLLQEATVFFKAMGDFDIGEHEASPDTFERLSAMIHRQIVVLDESSNYKSTSIFPQLINPNDGSRQNSYDVARDTIYLLRVRYPMVDSTKQGIGSESFYHYHGMVSPNGLLHRQLKKICLYCLGLFDMSWFGHACKDKRRVTCKMCHRVSVDLDYNDLEGSAAVSQLIAAETDPLASKKALLFVTDWKAQEFCIKVWPSEDSADEADAEDPTTACTRCTALCRSFSCAKEHKRVSRCDNIRVCEKCKKPFVCLGDLAPRITRHYCKKTGKLLRTDKEFPTEHKNCFHSYCTYCCNWNEPKHLCTGKRPNTGAPMPWGLGSIHLEMRRDEEGRLCIQLASLAFHSRAFSRKNIDYCLLTDLVEEYKHEKTNFIHHSMLEGFSEVPYLESELMREAIRYHEGSSLYSKNPALKSTWGEINRSFGKQPSYDPQFELNHKVKSDLAKLYLADVENYVRNLDEHEVRKIGSNISNTVGQVQGEESEEQQSEQDDGGVANIKHFLASVGTDSESEESFAAFNSEAPGDVHVEQEQMNQDEGDVNVNDDDDEGDANATDYSRHPVGQRLIKFLTLAKFGNFTFSGYFDSGAEMALLLRECLIMGVPVRCTFQGRHVTSMTFSHKLRIINLRSFLPSPLFKMAWMFNFLRNWTWFPSHEIVRDNINEIWDTIPEKSWWRHFNIQEEEQKQLFESWHDAFTGEFDFNKHLVKHVYHRSILIMKIAMKFSHEVMGMEEKMLFDKRVGLYAGNNPVYVGDELTYVSNNHPLSKTFASMATYAFIMFKRFTTVRLPILQYHRHDNPASRSSMQELAYLEWLYTTEEGNLRFALRGQQQCFTDPETGTKIYVDGYVEGENGEPNRIFEFLGCYHHGCTLCFPNGSPFQKYNKVSLVAANEKRRKFLSQFGNVKLIWSHDIAVKIRDNPQFKAFYKNFTENDYKSFGWREGHTTGIVEAFGIYAHAGAITEHWKKHCSETFYQEATISQIDMNANYPSTLMKIKNKKLAAIVNQPAIPIPVDGLTTLFRPRIHEAGYCPQECWKSKCKSVNTEHECSILGCRISCEDHFNSDFYEVVSGMAYVTLLPPQNLMYPLVHIPIDVSPPVDDNIGGLEEANPVQPQHLIQSQTRKKVVNFLALCRQCALKKHLCRMEKEGVTGSQGEPLHRHCESCRSNLNFHSICTHTVEERAFEKVLPLNELAYILRQGYTVVKYHCIRYFSENTFWDYDDFMTRLSTLKVKSKGVPEGCEDSDTLRETLEGMSLEIDGLEHTGKDQDLRGQFEKKPILGKLCKMVGCLVVGKLAMDNDRTFTKIVHSFDEFTRLQQDETLNIESYYMLNPYTLLVTIGTVEGGDRNLGRSSCLLLASMVTAAARVNMFKVMNHLYKNEGYLTLYLGVDSLIVVPYATWTQPIQEVLPMHDTLSGYFGFQHKNIASAVIYGRNRYSVLNRDTHKVEFKFSGLSGIRNAGANDIVLNKLHLDIAKVLLTEVKAVAIPQAKVEISRDYMSITMIDEVHTLKSFHILDLKRGFFPSGILKNYCFRNKTGNGDMTPSLYPAILSMPLGYVPEVNDFFEEEVAYLMKDCDVE